MYTAAQLALSDSKWLTKIKPDTKTNKPPPLPKTIRPTTLWAPYYSEIPDPLAKSRLQGLAKICQKVGQSYVCRDDVLQQRWQTF